MVAINVPHYAEVDVKATSLKEAARIVNDSFDEDNYDSPYYAAINDWSSDWSGADDLRVADPTV